MTHIHRLWSALLLWTLSGPAIADRWAVEYPNSRLGFTATWEGEPFDGVFHRYRADIRFGPDAGDRAFEVLVWLSSVDTDSADRDQVLAEPDWFAPARFPRARFASEVIVPAGGDRYTAQGRLTLKGITRPIRLDMRWRETGDQAELTGETRLNRGYFRVGEGEWAGGETIGLEVVVRFHLLLTRGGPADSQASARGR